MFIINLQQLEQFQNVSGIYRFYFPNNKNYIGETIDLKDRLLFQYPYEIKRKYRKKRPLLNAINKYGWDNIQIELLDWGEHLMDKWVRQALETACIEEYNSLTKNFENIKGNGYNVCLFGHNTQGVKASQSTLKKLSECRRGIKHWNWGKKLPMSQITKWKIGISNAKVKHTPAWIKNVAEARKKPIQQINKNTNEIIKIWKSATDAALTLNISKKNINSVCKHRYGYKSAYGFKWDYA